MKKVVALLLAGVLTLGASMTAFAAPSPSGNTSNATITATSDQGNVIISQDYKTEAEKKAAQDLAAAPIDTLTSVVGADEAKDMSLVSVMDVSIQGTDTFPVTITFNVPGVTTSSKVTVLHYVNGQWQKENPTLGKGTVKVTFNSLSPVAIYVDKTTAANAGNTTSNGKAPKTGEAPVMGVVAAVAAMAALGMAVTVRRKEA